MRPIAFFLLHCTFLLAIISCNSQTTQTDSYDDFPLEVTEMYKKAYFGKLGEDPYYFYELKKPEIVLSFPIEGEFRVNPEGELCGFILSESHEINGTMIPKGSTYERFEDSAYFISFSKDTLAQGFPVYHKEDGFIFWSENNVYFFNDGTIKSFGLSEDMVIKGIPCNASKNNRSVELFRNGEIRHCALSVSMEIQSYPCFGGDANSSVWFRRDGEILSFILSEDHLIDDKTYAEGTRIIFNDEGQVHYLSGHTDFLAFYDNDRVRNTVLKDDLDVNNVLFSKGSRLVYSESGELNSARITQNVVIQGIPCQKKDWVGFHPNGNLSWCKLSEELELQGVVYAKGTWLNLDDKGKVLSR